ncbi:MAG: hypothetical protein KAI66_18365, partial [Lentisphaeria bacterium]|nr:hypothetical protein [Lentisphaeria bacterium]
MPATSVAPEATVFHFATIRSLKTQAVLQDGSLAHTTGFHAPGDGGGALYRVQLGDKELQPNGANVIALADDRVAVLLELEAVNYRMFGTLGDGESDDGVQIKLAHEYAGKHRIPIVNLSGEFWIRETNS